MISLMGMAMLYYFRYLLRTLYWKYLNTKYGILRVCLSDMGYSHTPFSRSEARLLYRNKHSWAGTSGVLSTWGIHSHFICLLVF